MRGRATTRIVAELFIVCLLTSSCTSSTKSGPVEPSQSDLARQLYAERPEFVRIRTVLNLDPRITEVWNQNQPVYGETHSGYVPTNDKRIASIRGMMRRLHVVWLYNDRDETQYTMWLGPPSWRKRVRNSSVDFPARDKGTSSATIFARIMSDWYVFWDWDS